jgi:elongation factor Ts
VLISFLPAAKSEKLAAMLAAADEQNQAKQEKMTKKIAAAVEQNQVKHDKIEAAAAAKPAPVAEAPKEEAAPEPVAEVAPAPAPAAGGEITPKTIKALRDLTGAGMMDCKKALIESEGDQDVAAEALRAKGLAQADKKSSRIAAEGKIAVTTTGNRAVMVEVNCETDFVGKDATFLAYCAKVAGAAIDVEGDSVESLMGKEVGGESLEVSRQALVSKIGENIQVRRLATRGGEGSTVGAYIHLNRIGVLVELEGGSEELAQDIAMHVAAMNPPYATVDDVPGDVVEKEKKFLTEQALESGKPEAIVGKMVEGRIRKYLEEIVLVSQTYVKDGDKTVAQLLEANGAKMIGFTRLVVGEGIEKKVDDFAAEVAAMAGTA